MRAPVVLPALALLGSCTLGPDPSPVAGDAPATIRGDASSGSASFGDRSWREVFCDPALRSLISRALDNNPDLVAATYRIEQARAQAAAARADWFPGIDGSAAAAANYASRNANALPPGVDRDSESYQLGARLSWEIDLWGGLRRSNEAARARLLEAAYQREAVRTSLIGAVASAYIGLKNLDERLLISKRTAESRRASLALVTARRDGGVSSDLEVGQAEALLGQALIAIPVTEQAIAAKENEIRSLLGEFPAPVARAGSMERLSASTTIAAGIPSRLLARRPDIAAADQAWQAALAEIGVAEALRLPSLTLTGSGGLASASLQNLLEGRSATFSIGPSLVGPLFDAGRGKARVDAAKARAGEALALHSKASRQAFREVADALDAYSKTGRIIDEQTKLVDSLRKVSSVARDRFEGGASSYLEVLDAERSLFTAELELADARRNRQLAVVEAYRALGGGWR
jgi:NodT family efflux transporter outer membrane factor (OMF) lipoprotein